MRKVFQTGKTCDCIPSTTWNNASTFCTTSLNIDPMTRHHTISLRMSSDVLVSDFMKKSIVFHANEKNQSLVQKELQRKKRYVLGISETRDGRGNMKMVSNVFKRTTMTTFNTAETEQEEKKNRS